MVRYAMTALLAAAPLITALIAPGTARAQSAQQELVDRSTLAVQDMVNNTDGRDAQGVLRRARAVVVCPQVFQAGFLFGGEGGGCVLVARDGAGSWSSPAFYGMGAGSFGLQAGMQDSEIMLMVMTDKGLRAIMDSQFKIGGEAGGTFVQWGGGIQGATTAALTADVIGFTRSRGLFAGVSISGSMLTTRSDWNRAYYGREEAAQQIVISMDANNPGASPLREVLTKFGSSTTAVANVGPAPVDSSPTLSQPGPRSGTVQRQALPPLSGRRY